MTTVRDLNVAIRTRHLLKHPFYQAWAEGNVTREDLLSYAGQYHHFESNFPRYVAGTYARLEQARDRRVLLENLIDEEGRSPTHPELWHDFARSLGATWKMHSPPPARPATRELCQTYEDLTLGPGTASAALGALYAYEAQFPKVAEEKSRGLRTWYGIRSKAAHEFFRVHSAADLAHSRAERRLLAHQLAQSPAAGPPARMAVNRTLEAWWGFLSSFGY
ncbi:MAG: CADD family putative folate metabolism protein [Thermoplasmata archaeon]